MKKLIVLIAALVAALFVVGCATKPTGPTAAELMSEAKSGAPAGTIVGQGTARGTKDNAASSQATQRSLASIKRALVYLAGEMVDAQVTAGRVSSSVSGEFKQAIGNALDKAALNGAVKVDSGADSAFVSWAIFSLSKEEALKELTTAVNSAKDVVSAGNFNFSDFEAKYPLAASKEWK
jgi:hypothetical protein